jgi:predicted nucleic acid-binding protein
MIVLDTNVVSEAMRSPSTGPVATWLESQPFGLLSTTSTTVAEILHGIRLLPAGKRRRGLEGQFQDFLNRGFRDRVLCFDAAAADAYSAFIVARQRRGRPVDRFDAMIAGVAVSRGADIATRNAADFRGCGARIVNPWAVQPESGA